MSNRIETVVRVVAVIALTAVIQATIDLIYSISPGNGVVATLTGAVSIVTYVAATYAAANTITKKRK